MLAKTAPKNAKSPSIPFPFSSGGLLPALERRLTRHMPVLGRKTRRESLAVVDTTIQAPFASVPDSLFLLRFTIAAQSDDEEAVDHLMGRIRRRQAPPRSPSSAPTSRSWSPPP